MYLAVAVTSLLMVVFINLFAVHVPNVFVEDFKARKGDPTRCLLQ